MKKTLAGTTLTVTAALLLAGCPSDRVVNLAAILPLTGEAALYGESIRKGIDLAMAEVAEDVELESQVNMTVVDSTSSSTVAAKALEDAYGGGAIAAIGGVTSDEALAMVPVADRAGKVLLSPSASSPKLSGASQNFFRIFPSAATEAVALATHALDTMEVDRIAILAAADAYGESLAQTFVETYGGTVMETLVYDPTTTDLGGLVARALALRKQANDDEARGFGVYVAASGEALTSLITALRGQGFSAGGDHLFASSALAHPQILGQLGGMAEGVYLTMTPYDPTSADEPMVSFAAAFEAKYNETPDYWAAHGYDAVKVFVQAIREGGVALPSEFRTGMRAVTDLTGVTGSIQFRETGDAQKYMRVYLISNGATREYEDYMKRRRQEITDRRRELEQRMREIENRLRQPPG